LSSQTAFLEVHFKPRFPEGFWPRLSPTGNALHALAKEMAVNYGVYMDTGLHALSALGTEKNLKKK